MTVQHDRDTSDHDTGNASGVHEAGNLASDVQYRPSFVQNQQYLIAEVRATCLLSCDSDRLHHFNAVVYD